MSNQDKPEERGKQAPKPQDFGEAPREEERAYRRGYTQGARAAFDAMLDLVHEENTRAAKSVERWIDITLMEWRSRPNRRRWTSKPTFWKKVPPPPFGHTKSFRRILYGEAINEAWERQV